MASTSDRRDAYVWVWLPGHRDPVVAGRVQRQGDRYRFGYGRSYLERPGAISLYTPELPLRPGWQSPADNLHIASVLRDAGPDAWGQRVIAERLGSIRTHAGEAGEIDQITLFLESGSDRIGALDFQESPTVYRPRLSNASLDELHEAAAALQEGRTLSSDLETALVRGTSVGGARPKVLISDDHSRYIAKFASTTDPYPVVNCEALALDLAQRAGIDVPRSIVTSSMGKDVLLVERFDRPPEGGRRIVLSGLTMLGLYEMQARYATYPDLLDILRRDGHVADVGKHLFERIVFNIAIGNNDDHARNHSAFWDGSALELTPAYDLCPQLRSGETSTQAMAIGRDGQKDSSFATCVQVAAEYGLTPVQARQVIDRQVEAITANWRDAADRARLTRAQRDMLWHRQILNPYSTYGYR